MAVFDIDGNIIDSAKEVWVDDYDSVTEALEDGDIINFTTGKLYEINNKITINKSCYLKGNGCIIHSEPREADPSNPRKTLSGEDTQLYVFDVIHDGVIIENFSAYSSAIYTWENGGELFEGTLGSNVYLVRISASNVSVKGITTREFDGAVRVADEVNNTAFSYHDIDISDITSLSGVINIYLGNVIRCTATRLRLSNSQSMQDSHGHCIYVGRAIKHATISDFVIYHNGGMLGGLSIHPSSTQDKSLCQYINISNGVIYSAQAETFAIQITWARHIVLSNITVNTESAKSVYISGEVNDIAFVGCVFEGAAGIVSYRFQTDYTNGQREIVYKGCRFASQGKAQNFVLMDGLQGTMFQACDFFIPNYGSFTAPQCILFSTKPMSASKNFAVALNDCCAKTLGDVLLNLFTQENSIQNEVSVNNTSLYSAASMQSILPADSTLVSVLRVHNVTGVNYAALYDAATWQKSSDKIKIDPSDTYNSNAS